MARIVRSRSDDDIFYSEIDEAQEPEGPDPEVPELPDFDEEELALLIKQVFDLDLVDEAFRLLQELEEEAEEFRRYGWT